MRHVKKIVLAVLIIAAAISISLVIKKTEHISTNNPMIGDIDAPVVVTLFGYIGCEHCEEIRNNMITISSSNESVTLVWKDYPNTSLEPYALSDAIAARCAHEQDHFWDFQTELISTSNTEPADISQYITIAEKLEMDTKKMETCISKQKTIASIQADIVEAEEKNISATPTFFINNSRYVGEVSKQLLEDLINAKL